MERWTSGATNRNVIEAKITSTGLICEVWPVQGGKAWRVNSP
jgi:hypothetical protein